MAEANTTPEKPKGIIKHETPLRHVYFADIDDTGQFREVAIVKEWPNGSLSYIDIGLIDEKDRQRLKAIVTNQHADKYALWELLDQARLDNGKNGLEYFHQIVRVKKAPGHIDQIMSSPGSLLTSTGRIESVPGTGFSNPASAQLNR
jgi:hypothetical protein